MYYNEETKSLVSAPGDKCYFCKKYKNKKCMDLLVLENLTTSKSKLKFLITDCECCDTDIERFIL